MTRFTVYQKDGSFAGFTCEDHAGYAEKGSDIVCAAVSALVINTVNSIETLTATVPVVESEEANARIRVSFPERPDHDAELLIRSLILGIQSIEDNEETKDFIDFIIEEV